MPKKMLTGFNKFWDTDIGCKRLYDYLVEQKEFTHKEALDFIRESYWVISEHRELLLGIQ